jgi:F-type H+-transporting ATPase subunit delta
MDVAIDHKSVEKVGAELDAVAAVVGGSSELGTVLTNPVFKASQRKQVMQELAKKLALSEDVQRFLGLLIERERIAALPDIARELRVLVDANLGRVRATVTSAKPLSADQESKIKTALEKQTGKKVVLEKREDADLIGGMVTQIGDLIYDGSVKNQLELMKETILKEEQHF